MPNDIDFSTEALLAHREKAEKATPGPWKIPAKHHTWVEDDEGNGICRMLALDSPRDTAAHIAANSPDVVKAHVDEILRLRNDLAATECREGEGDAYVEQLCLERDDLEAQVARLEGEVERLNQEGDYLAGVIAAAYCAQENVTHCEKTEGLPLLKLRDACTSCWREAARKAVEKQA